MYLELKWTSMMKLFFPSSPCQNIYIVTLDITLYIYIKFKVVIAHYNILKVNKSVYIAKLMQRYYKTLKVGLTRLRKFLPN